MNAPVLSSASALAQEYEAKASDLRRMASLAKDRDAMTALNETAIECEILAARLAYRARRSYG